MSLLTSQKTVTKRQDLKEEKVDYNALRNKFRQTVALNRMQGLRERCIRQRVLSVHGGTPVTEQMAIALRTLVFGQCPTPIRLEYFSRGPGINFKDAEKDLGFGLVVGDVLLPPNLRSILMAIQCHVLGALLFNTSQMKLPKQKSANPLKPTKAAQQEALCRGLADIFWKAGGSTNCKVCLPQTTVHFAESENYNYDGVTEKICVFDLNTLEETYALIRRYLHIFQEDPGPAILLIVYSAVLSRGIDRVCEDAGFRGKAGELIRLNGEIVFSTILLFLTGRAASYLHNGVVYDGNESDYAAERIGVTTRSPIGLLIWCCTDEVTDRRRLGSRLKTPIYPVWLLVCSEHSGVLFSDNRELLRDYHAENKFELHYYSSSHNQLQPIILSVSTRATVEIDEQNSHVLERIIRTKWNGAAVSWNSSLLPFL